MVTIVTKLKGALGAHHGAEGKQQGAKVAPAGRLSMRGEPRQEAQLAAKLLHERGAAAKQRAEPDREARAAEATRRKTNHAEKAARAPTLRHRSSQVHRAKVTRASAKSATDVNASQLRQDANTERARDRLGRSWSFEQIGIWLPEDKRRTSAAYPTVTTLLLASAKNITKNTTTTA